MPAVKLSFMRHYSIASFVAAAFAAMALISGCQDSGAADQTKTEPRTNFFTYDNHSFDINSVVKYDKTATAVELWLSAENGATTTEQIRQAGDYIVLRTNASYLGKRDYFKGTASKDSYVRFTEMEFAYGDEGTAYIEVQIENDSIKIDFLADKLYTKAGEAPAAILSGSYSGTFTVEKEQPYQNEWGFDRDRSDLNGAAYVTREDGGMTSVVLYEGEDSEAVRLQMQPDDFGREYTGNNLNKIILTYNGGVPFDLKNATGTISTSIKEETLSVNVNVTSKGTQMRAVYQGTFENDIVKLNRFIYNYDGESGVEGTQTIVKLMTKESGSSIQFYFSPSEGYKLEDNINYTHMPILTIPTDIVNEGKKLFKDIQGWSFMYDMMQVGPYESDFKPYPADEDWIEVNFAGGKYEVEVILSANAEGLAGSNIDLYYKGAPKN